MRSAPAMRGTASFRFYEELNDFLPPARRRRRFRYPFRGRRSVKDMIEALGVPHTEVDLILVNGRSVGFPYIVRDGDDISVYPVFESFDIAPLQRLRPKPLRVTRFVLDTHLGTLARYLRTLGFDSLYRNDWHDAELARISDEERRILLTRDVGLLKRSRVTRGCFLRETDPRRQLREVVARLDLRRSIRPFRRCTRCNGLLRVAAKRRLQGRVKPEILAAFDDFRLCRGCGQVYWPGSHYDRMGRMIGELRTLQTG
ncbi:MAG TPA: Mut7-C RNAse domain-containing protein [Nevskiales bacterium]|nr:Mut7-C RNAse domain-containing protein [Nevskiales bacterium]